MDTDAETSLNLLGLFLSMGTNPDLLFYIINSVILGVLLLLSAMVSGSEIALFSLTSDEYEQCQESDHKAERTAVQLLDKPQLLLATILIFNNLINVSFVTLSTFMTWRYFGTKALAWEVTFLLTVVVTILLLFFGELLPKVYATQNSVSFIRRTVYLINSAFYTLMPLSRMLVSMGNIIERRVKRRGYRIHIEELPEFIDEIPSNSETSDKEKEILKGIVNFGSITVNQIMTSRTVITALNIETPFHELLLEIQNSGYSRIPVYQDTIDRIEGILYVKDLLPFLEMNQDFQWNKLLRPRYFVPENKKIDKLLKDFQEKHVHMAIVVDEYGGTAGLITMEDIIEEIVGEINDEFDDSREVLYTRIDDHNYLFEGKIALTDFCKVMDVDCNLFEEVKGESNSLGGLMLELFSRMPKLNEEVAYEQFHFTIVSVSKKKIKIVKVQILRGDEQ